MKHKIVFSNAICQVYKNLIFHTMNTKEKFGRTTTTTSVFFREIDVYMIICTKSNNNRAKVTTYIYLPKNYINY